MITGIRVFNDSMTPQHDIIHAAASPDEKAVDFDQGCTWLGFHQIGLEISDKRTPPTVGCIRSETVMDIGGAAQVVGRDRCVVEIPETYIRLYRNVDGEVL